MSEAYENSYKLLIGETTYDELSKKDVFFLPPNHEDPSVTLRYLEEIEDYERCIKIRDKQRHIDKVKATSVKAPWNRRN